MKILIDDNKKVADRNIESIKAGAIKINELVNYYNSQKVLKPIGNKKEIYSFLKDPIGYLEDAIYRDIAPTVSEHAKPEVSKVADMFGIPYHDILGVLNNHLVYLTLIDKLSFDIEKSEFYLSGHAEKEIRESYRIYTEDEIQAKIWSLLKTTCKNLTEYKAMLNLDTISCNAIADNIRVAYSKDLGTFLPKVNVFNELIKNPRIIENFD